MGKENKKIIDYFYYLNKHNRINASYLFCGGGLETVLDIVKLANCTEEEYFCDNCDDCVKINKRIHPDVFIVDNGRDTIKIDTIREAQKFLHFKNFQSRVKTLIINNAHMFTEAASNAFLKTLEEPPGSSMIMLISSRPDLILPTILSRCRKIYMSHYEKNEGVLSPKVVEFVKNRNVNIYDRKSLSAFMADLIFVMRDYMNFKICANAENLINKNNYEIIGMLDYSLSESRKILDDLLKIYSAIDNVNVNLACNLLEMAFYRKEGIYENSSGKAERSR